MPAGEVSLGLIGVGQWGRKIAWTIGTLPGARLAAVASNNPDTAGFVPPGCRIHADWRALLVADDLQGIIIATPVALHAQMLMAAVEAGKAVLVEKPLAASRDEASALRRWMAGRNGTVLVDHVHLFHPAFRALQREAAALGPLRFITSAAGKIDKSRGLSVLWDWAPHDLAMCLALAPGPARIAKARWQGAETIEFSLMLEGGVEARVELSASKPRHRWFAATCDGGVLVYRDEGGGALVRLQKGEDLHAPGTPIQFDEEPPLRVAIAEFADAIRQGDRGQGSLELGLSVVDLIADIEDHLPGAM